MISILKEDVNLTQVLERFALKAPLRENQQKWVKEHSSPDSRLVHLWGTQASGRTTVGLGMLLACSLGYASSCMYLGRDRNSCDSAKASFLKMVGNLGEPAAIIRDSREEIGLANSSRVFFRVASDCATRGMSLNTCFLDFSAKTMESLSCDLLAVIIPSVVSKGGRLLISLGE